MARFTRGDGLRWVLGALVVALCFGLFFQLFEYRSGRKSTGYVGEARYNDYFAAGRLIEQLGVRVRGIGELRELRPLPPTDTVIVAPTQRRGFSEALHHDLREWVISGGHLVVVTWTLADDPGAHADPLLDPLGVRQHYNAFHEVDDDVEGDPDDAMTDGAPPEPDGCTSLDCADGAYVDLPGAPEPLRVIFDPDYRLDDPGLLASLRVGDENGLHVVQLPLGEGHVTVLTDDLFLRNGWIRSHDHGEFGARLLLDSTGDTPREVWFVYGEAYPSLAQLLQDHAWPVLLAGALWIACALWMRVPRFGPLLPAPERARRSLAEHLLASARFGWRADRGRSLLAAVRRELEAAWRRSHAGATSRLSIDEASAALAWSRGDPRERVRAALADEAPSDARDFTQRIRTLETLRRSL